MTRKRFKKIWTLLRLWLVLRELKRRRPPLGPMAFVLLALGCSYVGAPAKDPLVVIMRDGLPACSGFAIAKDKVITAAHCVTQNDDIEVVTAEQWQKTSSAFTPARVEFRDPARDIALLSGEFNFTRELTFREARDGEPVFARSIYFGAITDGNILPGSGFFRDTTLSVKFGWSGSPVFGVDGKVVGFVHSCVATAKQCTPFNAQIAVLP